MISRNLVDPRRQGQAVGAYFAIIGIGVGAWVARIPEIQLGLGIDKGRLGLVLLMSAVGALVAMPLAGRLAGRTGARALARWSAVAICATLPLIPRAASMGSLMAVFAAYGAATGIHGVAINALATQVEGASGRKVMSTFHGLFSLGGLLGSALGAGCIASGLGTVPSLDGAAMGVGLAYLVAGAWLPEASVEPKASATNGTTARARWTIPPRRLLVLGGLAFLGLVGEGSMGDWSAVYLRESLGSSDWLAGLGYTAYSLGMTAGRFAGDRLTQRLGDVALLRLGATLGAVGMLAAIVVPDPRLAIAGFVLVGAGLANAVPILYRAAARTPGVEPVVGIATTSTVGYLGFLAGPPLIGLIAHVATLGVALGLVGLAIGVVALNGRIVADETDPDPANDPDRTLAATHPVEA